MTGKRDGDGGGEAIQLSLFKDWGDLENFGNQTISAFHACLEILEISGRALASTGQAVMLSRLIIQMLHYKAEQAKVASKLGVAVDIIDRDISQVWPTFEKFIDAEIKDAAEVLGKLQEAAKQSTN
jgi:hypothetical protein